MESQKWKKNGQKMIKKLERNPENVFLNFPHDETSETSDNMPRLFLAFLNVRNFINFKK